MSSHWNAVNQNYKNMEDTGDSVAIEPNQNSNTYAVDGDVTIIPGYKRVAWPPLSEERIIREFTPQRQASPFINQPPASKPLEDHNSVPPHYPQVPAEAQSQQQGLYQQQPPSQNFPQHHPQSRARTNCPPNNERPSQERPLLYQAHPQAQQQQQQQPPLYTDPYAQPVNHHQQQQQPQPQYKPATQYQQAQFQQPNHYQQPTNQQLPYQQPRNQPPTAYQQQPPLYNQQPTSPQLPYNQQPQYNQQPFNQQTPYQPTPPYQQSPYQQSQPFNNQQPQYQSAAYQQTPPPQNPYQQFPQGQQYQKQQTPNPQLSNQQHFNQQFQNQQLPNQQHPPQLQQQLSNQSQQSQQQPISLDQVDFKTQQQFEQLSQDHRGGSPGIMTLRDKAPITQKPAPVYNSQPAAHSYQGGTNMRGDLKWPPPEYKAQAEIENEQRRALALGPVCRPRRINRDYTSFFAKNAINSSYPSYKVPPGTQHIAA